jgi:hypothetical protein
VQDRAHELELVTKRHQHEEDMAQHELRLSQLNLLTVHGRDMLAIMPASVGRPAVGPGPGTTEMPGPGRVFGAV